eukprot:8700231-Alexandrium_andersonii.AAC.1
MPSASQSGKNVPSPRDSRRVFVVAALQTVEVQRADAGGCAFGPAGCSWCGCAVLGPACGRTDGTA